MSVDRVKELQIALKNLLARIDDHFGCGSEYDWKEQKEARDALAPTSDTATEPK
jgi:hypothetical protein